MLIIFWEEDVKMFKAREDIPETEEKKAYLTVMVPRMRAKCPGKVQTYS